MHIFGVNLAFEQFEQFFLTRLSHGETIEREDVDEVLVAALVEAHGVHGDDTFDPFEDAVFFVLCNYLTRQAPERHEVGIAEVLPCLFGLCEHIIPRKMVGEEMSNVSPDCKTLVAVDSSFPLLHVHRIGGKIPVHYLAAVTMEVKTFLTDRSGSENERPERRVERLLQAHVVLHGLVVGLHFSVGVVIGVETVHCHLLLVVLFLGFAEGFGSIDIDGRDADKGLRYSFCDALGVLGMVGVLFDGVCELIED